MSARSRSNPWWGPRRKPEPEDAWPDGQVVVEEWSAPAMNLGEFFWAQVRADYEAWLRPFMGDMR